MEDLEFGEWLEDQYTSRGWTGKYFASLVGVGNTTVSNWVNGQMPDAQNCDRIATALGIDRNEIRRRAGRREVTVGLSGTIRGSSTARAELTTGEVAQVHTHDLLVHTWRQIPNMDLPDASKAHLRQTIEYVLRMEGRWPPPEMEGFD